MIETPPSNTIPKVAGLSEPVYFEEVIEAINQGSVGIFNTELIDTGLFFKSILKQLWQYHYANDPLLHGHL